MPRSVATYVLILVVLGVSGTGCRDEEPNPGKLITATTPQQLSGADLIVFLEAHEAGVGHMERYEYDKAANAFRRALALAPGSNVERLNLALALLNDTGAKVEAEKSADPAATPSADNFQQALELLDLVLQVEPDNVHAHYSRGIILQYLGRSAEAHKEYQFVVKADPSDAHAWLNLGATLTDPKHPDR
ncbi:MAG TPA: tetratricopeptide repeat protein, partial [Isosphaeraceae bacterium]|nr:tetratricopeptide repeat protein [Isosphaeraceae bacterium]